MELYFSERCEILMDLFDKHNGYKSEQIKPLIKFWRTISVKIILLYIKIKKIYIIQEDNKKKYYLNFIFENDLSALLKTYFQ